MRIDVNRIMREARGRSKKSSFLTSLPKLPKKVSDKKKNPITKILGIAIYLAVIVSAGVLLYAIVSVALAHIDRLSKQQSEAKVQVAPIEITLKKSH